MPAIVPEQIEVSANAEIDAPAELVADPAELAGPRMSGVRKYIASVAVWLLYVPHYAVLWTVGPRLGLAWVRLAANVHWLLTFLGAQRSTRRSLERMHPLLGTNLSVSAILRKHLEMKHECFARVRVYNLHGAVNRLADIDWRPHSSRSQDVPTMEGRERGLVVVGYHFGLFQLSATALAQLVPGCNPVQLRYRIARCVEEAMSPVARLVMRRAIEADRRSGAPIFYIDNDTSLLPLFRLLRKGGSLSLAADGMFADDFVEVPFFDGTIRVPNGWARLAAATRSEILFLYDTQTDAHHREAWFYSQESSADTSSEAVRLAIADAIQVLEIAIRREPWSWHPWQRLRWERGPDGAPRYFLRQFGAAAQDPTNRDLPAANIERRATSNRAVEEVSPSIVEPAAIAEKPTRPLGKKTAASINGAFRRNGSVSADRPRVAIVCNSLTPYRIHLHERIVAEVPEIELWSLATHSNAYERWAGRDVPAAIRPVIFSHGEPTNEQAQSRHSLREWNKGGRILEWLDEHDISAVFCQGCGDAGRLRILHRCYRRKIPCFLTGDFNICSDNLVGPKRWLKRQIYGRAIASSAGLMPCGAHGSALFNRYGGKQKPQFLFPFVPDTNLFENTPIDAIESVTRRFGLARGRRRIVFSARMMPAKRPDLAIAAFAAIADQRPDWDLIMLGDGVMRAALERGVSEQLRSRIIWTGFLNETRDVAGLYAQSDMLLLPSDHEPWGVVVAEAAAAGLAIVASDVVGAAPELVHDGLNGRQFARGDLNSLIRALLMSTTADWIEDAKRQSRHELRSWLAEADPVNGFRAALGFCRLIPNSSHAIVPKEQRTRARLPQEL
jgi:glycosyltransferase involved in cell wall biosynthesis/lauroyl/myristoyl acyltransferase